ncbi:hypothetical protein SCB49_07097 [unidentified eubacterium SCB49]|nr:hypothetical protein SCB49_07097 [unidentified eubacterium SCB49]
MYGNFDAIKRRQKLRKEKTDLSSNQSDRLGKKHSNAEVQKAIQDIKTKYKKERYKTTLVLLFWGIIPILITVYLISKIIN